MAIRMEIHTPSPMAGCQCGSWQKQRLGLTFAQGHWVFLWDVHLWMALLVQQFDMDVSEKNGYQEIHR